MRIFSFLSLFRRNHGPRPAKRAVTRAVLGFEALEARALMSCNVVSGYVYNDLNHNGIRDPGEQGIAGSTVELRDAGNHVISTTTTDANGYYEFTNDPNASPEQKSVSQSIFFDEARTGTEQTKDLNQFNPDLGVLTAVEFTTDEGLTTTYRVENLDAGAATIQANGSGTVTLRAPGVTGLESTMKGDQSFSEAAFDGTVDFGGASGVTSDPKTVHGTGAVTVTDPGALAPYVGTGKVQLAHSAKSTATISGTGNLAAWLETKASGHVTVTYHYRSVPCLMPGAYSIVQTSQPAGYLEGFETSGNQAPIPGSVGTERIQITLTDSNSRENNFAEVLPGKLAGWVYEDTDNTGVHTSAKPPIASAALTLTGMDDLGAQVSLASTTLVDGSYAFNNLRPGTYTLTQSQLPNYVDGKDRVGSLGGTLGQDQIAAIPLGAGQTGTEYNFGELKPVTAPETVPPVIPVTPVAVTDHVLMPSKWWFIYSMGRIM